MPANEFVLGSNATNANILNAIRTDASVQYQQRIPAATQGNIQDTVAKLWEFRPFMNEFVDALVNRIGDVIIRSKVWNNPLAQFKRGQMYYGDTIQDVYVDLLKAKRYDPNVDYEDVFKTNKPNIEANYHRLNRQDMYEVTVNEALLNRAFVNEYGVQSLVSQILETPYQSDYWDEYLIMKNLLREYANQGWFSTVQVPDVLSTTTREDRLDAAARLTEAIRSMAGRLRFRNNNWNAQGVSTFTNAEDLVLFATPDIIAALDVNLIAFAFNVSAADMPMRVVEIDDFGIDGCQAILVDRDWFVCADTLIQFESIRNPKQLSWNYWLHHWGIYSASLFCNAVMFTSDEGMGIVVPDIEVTSIDLALQAPAVDVERGSSVRIMAAVNGTVDPEMVGYTVPLGIRFAITGTSGEPVAQRTRVDAEGVLHVAWNELNTEFTITATSSYINPKLSLADQAIVEQTITVPVVGAINPIEEPAS